MLRCVVVSIAAVLLLNAPLLAEQFFYLGVDYDGLSPEQQRRAAGVLAGLRPGQPLTDRQVESAMVGLKALDPVFQVMRRIFPMPESSSGDGLHLEVCASRAPVRVRDGSMGRPQKLVYKVDPAYPPLAAQAHVQGSVRFHVIISTEGVVENVQLQAGHPFLVAAAMEAVKRYRYSPAMLNCQPISAALLVEVNFTLNQ